MSIEITETVAAVEPTATVAKPETFKSTVKKAVKSATKKAVKPAVKKAVKKAGKPAVKKPAIKKAGKPAIKKAIKKVAKMTEAVARKTNIFTLGAKVDIDELGTGQRVAIAKMLKKTGGATRAALIAALPDISPANISWHLSMLISSKLVSKTSQK